MGTRQHPSEYDCAEKLLYHEPNFILRSTDLSSPLLVKLWASMRRLRAIWEHGHVPKDTEEKCQEAEACAEAMILWREEHKEKH